MFKLFNNKDDNKEYKKSEVYTALKKDGIAVTEQDIQKERENDLETFFKIGDAYYKKKKYDKAFAWFHKAALHDHADAQAQLGIMYYSGQGVSIDHKQAMDWSMKAASTGIADAQYNTGYLYYYGRGVTRDYKQAMNWYLKAADNGNTNAMHDIGRMYRYGEGVTKYIPTAIDWYTKAANQGNAVARYMLGDIYENNDEFRDLQKAVNWYQKIADNGDRNAKEKVKKLNKQGYYVKEDQQERREAESIQSDVAISNISSEKIQPLTTSNNDEQLGKIFEDKIKAMEKIFQSKISLMEVSTDALKKELAALKQKELQQQEENMKLRDELAKLRSGRLDSASNDLTYDVNSVEKNEMENDALQKQLASLKQKELEQHEEIALLKERLVRMEAMIQDDATNDIYYDSSDNESNNKNDINYDTECSSSEEEDGEEENEDEATANSSQNRNHHHHHLIETYAGPNTNSSENEDPKNDLYLD